VSDRETPEARHAGAKTLTISVPWGALCSDNRKFLSGRFVLSAQYRESKHAIGLYALAAARQAKWSRPPGPLTMVVCVTEPDHRKRDLNWQKNAQDGITESESVWFDDSQVRDARWYFADAADKATAGAVITISSVCEISATLQPRRKYKVTA